MKILLKIVIALVVLLVIGLVVLFFSTVPNNGLCSEGVIPC